MGCIPKLFLELMKYYSKQKKFSLIPKIRKNFHFNNKKKNPLRILSKSIYYKNNNQTN